MPTVFVPYALRPTNWSERTRYSPASHRHCTVKSASMGSRRMASSRLRSPPSRLPRESKFDESPRLESAYRSTVIGYRPYFADALSQGWVRRRVVTSGYRPYPDASLSRGSSPSPSQKSGRESSTKVTTNASAEPESKYLGASARPRDITKRRASERATADAI
jgi:hypothetical protein